jgi:hypothetical protein
MDFIRLGIPDQEVPFSFDSFLPSDFFIHFTLVLGIHTPVGEEKDERENEKRKNRSTD